MNKRRLLAVDGDPAVVDHLKKTAKQCGYDAAVVTSTAEFKREFFNTDPTFVILDLFLGSDADGIELLRFLASQQCKCPILVMSNRDERVLRAATHLGETEGLRMMPPLHKPVEANAITELLQREEVFTPTENRLAKAIREYELVLYYQPKIDLKTRKATGVEALVRWQPPHQILIYPDAFIPLAERTGMIRPLTLWVVEQALTQLLSWREAKIDLNVAVNISAKLLMDLSLPDTLTNLVKQHQIPPENITLEITETAVMNQPLLCMDVLTRLRIKGFSLSMDDFGTGYSSMLELQRLPFNQMKLDRSFVMSLSVDAASQAITKASILLAHSLGLTVVAEGVENKKAEELLVQMGCDEAQGFYICRPQPADLCLRWLRDNDYHRPRESTKPETENTPPKHS